MDTPLGLSYQPSFPSMQSLFTQMNQMRMLQAKQAQENAKNAETRAVQAVRDYAKFHPDRPYVKALEPYFQSQTQKAFELQQGVRNRTIPPEDLYNFMVEMQSDADKAKRYDVEVTTFMNKWKDSGNYDMNRIQQMYANHTVDLNSTDVLGTVTMLPPSAVDPNNFINTVILDETAYNKAALSEKFITALKKTEEDTRSAYDPATGVISKTTTLPSQFFHDQLSSSGNNTLNLGAVDSDQSRTLLARFRNMGADWDNYLQLRTGKEIPGFANMKAGSKEWGVAMQKTLQNLMNENGYIGEKVVENALRPLSEADKTGTAFNANLIGGSRKEELRYTDEAGEYLPLFSRNLEKKSKALDMFKGKGIKSATLSDDGSSLTIKLDKDYVVRMGLQPKDANGNLITDPSKLDEPITIPLTPDHIKELSSYANITRPSDLNPTYLKRAYEKISQPTAEDIAKFDKAWAKAKSGDHVLGVDGEYYIKP